ncbi:MAG: prepilin-type N-terminal cleavage/methylation domain-containing protein [Deltaproteobacteria bacterium]|nr:prepilin-type N-terminal cleavage/methylation domain-containing protein [Deltaproteobacteria bacterium]
MFSKTFNRGFTLVETIIFILVLSVGAAGIMTLYQNVLSRGADPLLRHKGLVLAQDLMDEILSKRWDEHTPNGGGGLDACDGGVKDGRNDTGSSGNSIDCDPAGDDDDASTIGLDAGELATTARQNWNDLDDYDGLVEDNQNGATNDDFKDSQGNLISEVGSFRRRVLVTYVMIAAGDGSSGSPYSFALAGNGRGTQDPDSNCGSGSPRTNFKQVVVTVTTPNNEEIRLVSIKGNY